jgi:hypothetical protein
LSEFADGSPSRPAIICQRLYYGNAIPASKMIAEEDDLEEALVLAEE